MVAMRDPAPGENQRGNQGSRQNAHQIPPLDDALGR